MVASSAGSVVSGTLGVKGTVFGEGSSTLSWEDPLAHGVVTRWDAGDFSWQAHALLDDDPTPGTGSATPHWLDQNAASWTVASGWLGGPIRFPTDPPQLATPTGSGGDGYVGLLDPDLSTQCAWWMPGPDVEDVRAAIDDQGRIAVVGSFYEITLEPGTPRERKLTGPGDGFVAWFAPP